MISKHVLIKYFEENPNEVKYKRGLLQGHFVKNSYIIDRNTQEITVLSSIYDDNNYKLGEGSFGKVKKSQLMDDLISVPMVTKIQKIMKDDSYSRRCDRVINEAKINIDVGVALADCVIRHETSFSKIYQNMYDLGVSLATLNKGKTLPDKIKWAIELLIAIDELHTGKTSKTHTPYIHHDIKPANILVDNQGKLRLIDFGFATSELDTERCVFGSVTMLPISTIYLTASKNYFVYGFKHENIAYNGFEKDKIAALRTIYHPIYSADTSHSLLTTSEFYSLPLSIQVLLCTRIIPPFFQGKRKSETVAFFAAVLIIFKLNSNINPEQIAELRDNPDLQKSWIATYNQTPDQQNSEVKTLEDIDIIKAGSDQHDSVLRMLNLFQPVDETSLPSTSHLNTKMS